MCAYIFVEMQTYIHSYIHSMYLCIYSVAQKSVAGYFLKCFPFFSGKNVISCHFGSPKSDNQSKSVSNLFFQNICGPKKYLYVYKYRA